MTVVVPFLYWPTRDMFDVWQTQDGKQIRTHSNQGDAHASWLFLEDCQRDHTGVSRWCAADSASAGDRRCFLSAIALDDPEQIRHLGL